MVQYHTYTQNMKKEKMFGVLLGGSFFPFRELPELFRGPTVDYFFYVSCVVFVSTRKQIMLLLYNEKKRILSSIFSISMSSPAAVYSLTRVATFHVPSKTAFNLIISCGSVVDFSYNSQSSAIVNAANEGCLGGGGVDGAISNAGGPTLLNDRMNLPQLETGVRCRTGSAVLTGPNSYGSLRVPYVIHAVGPNYLQYDTDEEMSRGDELLSSAYLTSLECGKSQNLESIAFALLSAGIFRGKRSVNDVLRIGIEAICKFDGYPSLQEVHLCAFNQNEADTLIRVATSMGLSE